MASKTTKIQWEKSERRNDTIFGAIGRTPTYLDNDFKLSYSGHWDSDRAFYVIDTREVTNHHSGEVLARMGKRDAKKMCRLVANGMDADAARAQVVEDRRNTPKFKADAAALKAHFAKRDAERTAGAN